MSARFWKGVWEFFRRSLWPASFSGKLGRILGAFSMLRLIELGFTSGFGALLGMLLEYYDKLLGWLLWPIEPFIKARLAELHQYIGWPDVLYAHWKHVFVLLGLYMFREANIGRVYGLGHVILTFLLGLITALIFGVLAGTVPLTKADQTAQFLFAAVLILGAAVYALIGFVAERKVIRQLWAEMRNKPMPSW